MKVGWVSYLQFSHADSGLISSLCFCLEFPSLPTPPHQPGNSGHFFFVPHLSVPCHPPPLSPPRNQKYLRSRSRVLSSPSAQQSSFQQKVKRKGWNRARWRQMWEVSISLDLEGALECLAGPPWTQNTPTSFLFSWLFLKTPITSAPLWPSAGLPPHNPRGRDIMRWLLLRTQVKDLRN